MSTLFKNYLSKKREEEKSGSLFERYLVQKNTPTPEPVPVDYAARTAETASKAKAFASSMAGVTEEQKAIGDLTQKENLLAEETQRVNQFATNDGEEAPRNIRGLERQASGAKATAQTVLIPKKYENVARTAEDVTKPGIAGQAATWSMNFDVGRLSQEIAKATQQSIAEPTPENKKLVETLKTTYDKYIERNREAMFYTDKNGEQRQRGNALTLTFANYVPQLIDQIAAQVPAVIAAGAVGAATGGAGFNPTLKALGALTAGQMSYNVVRGSAYDNLLSLGIPEDKAKALSQDEAFKSTLVEMAEYLLSFKVLGIDKLAGAISGLGTKVVADLVAKTGKEALAQAALRKFAKALGAYGINILSEGLEEYVQEGFAIESEKKGLGDARTVTPEEDAKRKAESFKGGATIAAFTGGPAIAGTTIATNKILSSKAVAQTDTPTAPINTEPTPTTPTTPTASAVQENVTTSNVEPVATDNAPVSNAQQGDIAEPTQFSTGPKEELSTQAVEKKETLTKNATVGLNLNEYTGNLREDERRAIDVMGKVTKNKVIFSENVGTVDGKETVLGKGETPDNFQQQNGFYDPKTKTIFLNMDLEDKAFPIALHEVTHHIQRSAPEAYARYKSVALEGALKLWGDGAVERTQAFAERSAGIQLTTEQAQDEIVADYIGYIYKDPARITNLYTTQKSFAVAIKDALTVLVNKIKRALSVMKYSKAERADMEAQKARYERDISMWEKAFDAASRGEGAVDGDVEYSLRDSEGATLTKEQQEYFKDSRVRDKEGNLLRVYHGTDKEFTEFKQGVAQGWGKGSYFTDSKEAASEYGNKIIESYLDLKNPYKGETISEEILEATKAYEKYSEEYDIYNARDLFSEYEDFVGDVIRELGYDGVMVWEGNNIENGYEIVAFSPEQIKSIENKNPTNSPDIRRSLRGAPTSPKTSTIKYNLPFVSTAPDGIIKRSDIEKFVASSIDRPVSSGKVRMRNVLGYFSVKSEAIRLKDPKNIPTLFHETGHFLDKRLEIFKDKDPKIQQELTKLGTPKSMPSYSAERVRGEGVAEFTKYYILDEQRMQNNYPNLYAKMEDIVSQDDNLKHMFEVLRTAIDNYRGMTPEQRFASNISMQDVTVKRKWDFDRLYTALFDDLNAIKLAVKEMTGGIDLKVDDDPYALATLNHSWQSLAQTYLESGFVDDKYEKSGKGLKEILDPIADKTTFQYYMVARRARELGLRQIKTGLEWQDVIDIIAKYDSEYAAPFAEVLEYQDNILRQLVKEQIISKEVYTAVKLMNQDYVPMYRVIESFTKRGTGKGMQASNPMRGIKGSEADIIAPLESIIKNTYLFTAMAEKNRIGLAFWRITENFDGTGKYMEKIPAPMKGQSFTISEIENVLLDAGLEEETLKKINLNEVATIFRPGRYSKNENVITIYKDGKPMYFEVHNEDLYRALEGLDRESSNTLIKILSYPAKALRAGAILNPDFLLKNPTRDALTALIYSRYGFVPGFDTVRGLFHAIKKDKLYYQAMASGALQSSFVSMDRNYLQSSMKDLLTDSVKDKALNIVTNPLEALRMLSEFSESATRLGEFARGIEKYGSTREGVQRAALATREVAIDFARGGNVSKSANRAIAFFNSSLQGTDKMIREFKRDPFGMTLKSVAYITIPSLLLYAKNKDEPRYQELPDWQKDLFWIILTEDKIFRIPKPFELGVLFGSAFERIAEYIDKKDPKAFDGFGESLETSLVPGYLPTAMIPIIEALTNYSLFKQYRLVSDALLGKEPWAQYTEYTSETAKAIGKILNVSPILVENTIYGYGAGLAKYGTDIVDVVLKAANLVEGKTTPGKGIEELPLIKGFMAVAYRNAASINEFYDLKTEISRKINTYDSVDPKLKLQQKQLEVTAVELGKIRKQIDAIYGNPRYTAERQKELIDKLNIQMVNLARRSLGKDPIKN